MTITAKFSGFCPCCNGRINAGDKVEWTKGAKAKHVACANSGAQSAVVSNVVRVGSYAANGQYVAVRSAKSGRSRGSWTGCSCGSVEEYSRDSDCRSCRHDAE